MTCCSPVPPRGTAGDPKLPELALLSTTGYKVSWKKARICRQEVKYLGSVISKGHQEEISHLFTTSVEHQEVRELLGAAGFCRIWIPGFSEIAKPLFKATAGSDKDPLEWGPQQGKAFEEIETLDQCSSISTARCDMGL